MNPSEELLLEKLFADFLLAREQDPTLTVEAACAQHPHLVPALRANVGLWDRISRQGASAAEAPSLPDRLRTALGVSVGQSIVLDSDEDSIERAALGGERLEKLRERGLALKRYTIRGKIEEGGQGVLYKAFDEDLKRTVAIKVMRPRQEEESIDRRGSTRFQSRLERFLEEAQIASQLQHPGIVPVHDLGVDANGKVFFVMQFIRGEHFGKTIEKSRAEKEGWNLLRAIEVIVRVGEAMEFVHSKRVIHRDLKPANIMVGRYGEAYVMDWGLARPSSDQRVVAESGMVGDKSEVTVSYVETDRHRMHELSPNSPLLTRDGQALGTPVFMAPEQAFGQRDKIGPATDVYSLGAVLYQLLTGRVPYLEPGSNVTPEVVVAMVCQGPPRPVNEIDPHVVPELQAICEKAMARLPEQRYRSMNEFVGDLRAFLQTRVVQAYESGAYAEFKKWVRRNKAFAGTAATLGMLIVAGLGAYAIERAQYANTLTTIALADRESREVTQLRDVAKLLESSWPGAPGAVESLQKWIRVTEDWPQARGDYERRLRELEDAVERESPFAYSIRKSNLEQIIGFARLLEGSEDSEGSIANVKRRLSLCERIYPSTLTDVADLWDTAIRSIADVTQCPKYAGLVIRPQLGLVPIRLNPDSGLWEFVHWLSGIAPNAEKGTPELTEETGIIFVLIPGGEYRIGAQSENADLPNYDPSAEDAPGVYSVVLEPYFISKFELTVAQYMRCRAIAPHLPAVSFETSDVLEPMREDLTWERCLEFGKCFGVALPTEAQWEAAARGGCSGPWHFGSDRAQIERYGNTLDLAAKTEAPAMLNTVIKDADLSLNDSFPLWARVDRFLPNPFGLFGVIGNVGELCVDRFGTYDMGSVTPGTGERIVDGSGIVVKDGAFAYSAAESRHWKRRNIQPVNRGPIHGVRFARLLDR